MPKHNRNILVRILANVSQLFVFMVLISLYVLHQSYRAFLTLIRRGDPLKWPSKVTVLYNTLVKKLDRGNTGTISRIYLVEISLKNMFAKKTRTWVTMGGMAIGIGLIVFLVSIGYGIEQLVLDRVARLDELRQTDVVPGISEDLALTDKSLALFKSIPNVQDAIPVIAAVGQVNYNNSVSNMAVYGVTTKYLKESAIQPIVGSVFDSNELTISNGGGTIISSQTPTPTATPKATTSPKVLGENTDNLPVVTIPDLSTKEPEPNVITLKINGRDKREVVVNRAVLTLLGLTEADAVDKKVKITLHAVDAGAVKSDVKIQSEETEYTIIGILPESGTPLLYVPFLDLRSLGVSTYSQIKIIVNNAANLSSVRTAVESSGYGTTSVVDTVSQIDKLFSSVRIFLAVLGIVALSVATLGMFNTLTVSLLERTREVGLMKAIGMKSSEVKELFMTESMIMGFGGGIFGLILGKVAGVLLSAIFSLLSFSKGAGFVSITYVPWDFSLAIILLSLLVGAGTGYIPARRATKISALDALRYE